MAKINVLGKDVYSLIAAGEVVERPMSVVKETIENSIDALAKNITVEIKNGGKTYIRITDDGTGILSDDMERVFLPHATSKISAGADLDAISTLGFRGEAMASIAAVAKVEVISRVQGEETGIRYEIEGGQEVLSEEAGCPLGTTVVVRDLFYNVPARMKFLKKDFTESNAVQGVVERTAMSHPEIAFRFIKDGRQVMATSGKGSLKDCVYSVLGGAAAEGMVAVNYEADGMKATGLTCKPHESRKSRAMQYFFINGRYVKSRTAVSALEQAYKNLIMVGHYPSCVINIEMPYDAVDVNVHPSKIEVRFTNERQVFDLIYYAVKSAVEAGDTIKSATMPGGNQNDYGGSGYGYQGYGGYGSGGASNSIKLDIFKKEPTPGQMKFAGGEVNVWHSKRSEKDEWEEFAEKRLKEKAEKNAGLVAKNQPSSEAGEASSPSSETGVVIAQENEFEDIKIVGEAFGTYIIVQCENDLYYIDKHAAHERMNYESLRAEAKEGIASQLLLQSVNVRLNTQEYNAVTENLELINNCVFCVEDFGEGSVIVRDVPAMLNWEDVEELIVEIAQKLLEEKTNIEAEKIDSIFHITSCRSAIKAGDKMSPEETELFVKRLFSMPNVRYCPHGRPVMIKISRYELEKQFGRIQ